MIEKFLKFFPLVKVDEAKRIVYGLVTAEVEDRDGETCHYETTKPEYQKVNEEMSKASAGDNIMPLREMHQLIAAGNGKSIEFRDAQKQILMGFEVTDDSTWRKVAKKTLLGFSQGGRYLKKWMENGKAMYTAEPGEISLVDRPCLANALIEYAKADGSIEMFKTADAKLTDADIDRLMKALNEQWEKGLFAKGVKYLVPDGQHLPYTDESGKPNHRLMGAAWAALHGGYRGNKYSGPGKEQAIAHLKEIYHSEGMEPPSEKAAAIAELEKGIEQLEACSDLDTEGEKILSDMVSLVAQLAKGVNSMTPEQIKKCAAALGISEEEFKKRYVEGDALEKGKKGLAALHAHLKKAVAHHDKMHAMHKTMADHHATMSDHLENCMKAHGACMDDAEAEKVLKALGVNPAPAADPKNDPPAQTELEKKLQAQIDELKKAVDTKPADDAADKARLFAIERGKSDAKRVEQNNPFPV